MSPLPLGKGEFPGKRCQLSGESKDEYLSFMILLCITVANLLIVASWLVGWLVDQLFGWLVGWFGACFVWCLTIRRDKCF